jgi:hypothetical protein
MRLRHYHLVKIRRQADRAVASLVFGNITLFVFLNAKIYTSARTKSKKYTHSLLEIITNICYTVENITKGVA